MSVADLSANWCKKKFLYFTNDATLIFEEIELSCDILKKLLIFQWKTFQARKIEKTLRKNSFFSKDQISSSKIKKENNLYLRWELPKPGK